VTWLSIRRDPVIDLKNASAKPVNAAIPAPHIAPCAAITTVTYIRGLLMARTGVDICC
jgi:hypothetical protein